MKEMIFGQGGAVVLVGMIMGVIKKKWKPEKKELYLIPATLLGLIASGVVSFIVGWHWGAFLIGAILITGGQLFTENELFPELKDLWEVLQELLTKKI
jgi:hypothetical protein